MKPPCGCKRTNTNMLAPEKTPHAKPLAQYPYRVRPSINNQLAGNMPNIFFRLVPEWSLTNRQNETSPFKRTLQAPLKRGDKATRMNRGKSRKPQMRSLSGKMVTGA